eukprot:7617617-Pyramimonas_sp.AAC.1
MNYSNALWVALFARGDSSELETKGGGRRQSRGGRKRRGGRERSERSNGRKPRCAQAKLTLRAETVVRSF